ncbi:unnamed protein product [Caretta caretta]
MGETDPSPLLSAPPQSQCPSSAKTGLAKRAVAGRTGSGWRWLIPIMGTHGPPSQGLLEGGSSNGCSGEREQRREEPGAARAQHPSPICQGLR